MLNFVTFPQYLTYFELSVKLIDSFSKFYFFSFPHKVSNLWPVMRSEDTIKQDSNIVNLLVIQPNVIRKEVSVEGKSSSLFLLVENICCFLLLFEQHLLRKVFSKSLLNHPGITVKLSFSHLFQEKQLKLLKVLYMYQNLIYIQMLDLWWRLLFCQVDIGLLPYPHFLECDW